MSTQRVTLTTLADLAACVEGMYGQVPTNSLTITPFITDADGRERVGPIARHELLTDIPLPDQVEAMLAFIKQAPIENITSITIGIYTPAEVSASTLEALGLHAIALGWEVLDVYAGNEVEVYNRIPRHSRLEVQASPLALTLAVNIPEGASSITPQTPAKHPVTLAPEERPSTPADFAVLDTMRETPSQVALLEAWKNLVQGTITDPQRAIIAASLDNIETRYSAWFMGALAAVGQYELTEETAGHLLGIGITPLVGRGAIDVAQALHEQVGPLVDDEAPVLEFQLWANWLGGYFSRSQAFEVLMQEVGAQPNVERNIALKAALSGSTPAHLGRP